MVFLFLVNVKKVPGLRKSKPDTFNVLYFLLTEAS